MLGTYNNGANTIKAYNQFGIVSPSGQSEVASVVIHVGNHEMLPAPEVIGQEL